MSRNFTSEQTLIDQLLLDDTAAFEELYHRYCYPLYTYSLNKLNSPEDARRVVRDIFIALWEQRHSLPVNFSVSLHMYTEVRKSVVKMINEKLLDQQETPVIENMIIPGFTVMQLRQARQPVTRVYRDQSSYHPAPATRGRNYENQRWISINLKDVRHAFQHILNFW
jgi:hypothetical protein